MSQSETNDPRVAVIIAAYNAERTIATAVKSALMQDETFEVFVIDDASKDATLEIAAKAANGDPRFTAIKQAFNQGPSAARNVALARATAPFVAVLDSDDAFRPGRFRTIMAQENWDLCADNLHFTDDHAAPQPLAADSGRPMRTCMIDFETYVLGNLGRRNDNRTELGFLKPVIRRSFLEDHGLKFQEQCRLGEDFVLYTQMLTEGARFKLVEKCGYTALVRGNSLSAQHSISHLRAFLEASRGIKESGHLSDRETSAINRHIRHLQEKVIHREALDSRRYYGVLTTLWFLLRRPTAIRDILFDRFGGKQENMMSTRSLLTSDDFDRLAG